MTLFAFAQHFSEHGLVLRNEEHGIIPGGQESRRAHTHLIPSSSLMRKPHLARRNSDVLIFFNMADLQRAANVRGMKFFMSTNGYILTKHVLSQDLMFLVYDVRRDRPLKDLRRVSMPQELEDARVPIMTGTKADSIPIPTTGMSQDLSSLRVVGRSIGR